MCALALIIAIMTIDIIIFRTGKLVRTIEIPAETVTGAIYGGEDLDILFVTSSVRRSSFDGQKQEDSSNPESGKIFMISGLSSKSRGCAVLNVSILYICFVSQFTLVVLFGIRNRC